MLANPFDPNPNPCYLHVIYIENLKTLTLGRNGAITHVIYMLSTPIQPWCGQHGFPHPLKKVGYTLGLQVTKN